jgi:stage II sporulation protein D
MKDNGFQVMKEPVITVGIVDRQGEIACRFDGDFSCEGCGVVSGLFRAGGLGGKVALMDDRNRVVAAAPSMKFVPLRDSVFTLLGVTIGNRFHWERKDDQTFRGCLEFKVRDDGTMAAVNEIAIEDYLKSVISSEMNARAPKEFLKAHAIISRSWLLAMIAAKKRGGPRTRFQRGNEAGKEIEVLRWYDREDHDLFDVCADDHCQRYQGITRIVSPSVGEAVGETRGRVITYGGDICDARYSKACGGFTENFGTAWADALVPYLASVPDGPACHQPLETEEDAAHWILSCPDAYCNTADGKVLETILPGFDQETKGFFRWKVDYAREELEEIIRNRSGIDFGTLKELVPLKRGPSGRISMLKIVGTERGITVGKELEIRRWLSPTHLYSSAFIVEPQWGPGGEVLRFTFHGAGWGHGVGLCQIGAAVMAGNGFGAEAILRHYFRGTGIERVY